MTTSATARVRCGNPMRLAKSLVSRFAAEATTEWNGEEGRGHVTWEGSREVDMVAGDGVLLVHLECPFDEVERWEAVVGEAIAESGCEAVWARAERRRAP